MRKISIYFLITLLIFSQNPVSINAATTEVIEKEAEVTEVVLIADQIGTELAGYDHIDSIRDGEPDHLIPDEMTVIVPDVDAIIEVDGVNYTLVHYFNDEDEEVTEPLEIYVNIESIITLDQVEEVLENRLKDNEKVEEEINEENTELEDVTEQEESSNVKDEVDNNSSNDVLEKKAITLTSDIEKHQVQTEIQTKRTSKLARIRSSSVEIYESIGGNSSAAGLENVNHVYYVKEQASIGNDTYYLLSEKPSASRGIIGWVNSKDVSTHTHKGIDKDEKTLYIKGNGNARAKAWGANNDIIHESLLDYAGESLYVDLTERVGNNVWYRGKINGEGDTVWLHSRFVTENIKKSRTSKLARIKDSSARIKKEFGEKSTIVNADYIDRVYYVKQQAKLGNDTYYLLSEQPSASRGTIGWINSKDLSSYTHKGIDKKAKTLFIKGNGNARSKAWGAQQDVVHSSLASLTGESFHVDLTERVGNNTWYRGKINGKGERVWLHSNFVLNVKATKISKLARIKNSNVNIYEVPGGESAKAGSQHMDYAYYVKQQAVYQNDTYYLLSQQPSASRKTIGWVKAKDVSSHTHKGIDKKSKIYYIKGNGNARSKAWGANKDIVHPNMSQFVDRKFHINLTERVGNNTWYRGKINGEGENVWLHASFVNTEVKESTTSRLARIRNSDVKVYDAIGDKGTKAGSTYTNMVYYVKKQALLGNNTYYLLSERPSATKGTIGWVNSKDVSSHIHEGVDKKSRTFYIKGNGTARSKAWGAGKDVVHSNLQQYAGDFFQVNLTEKVGNNTWYRGKIKNKGGNVWLHSNFVTRTYEQTTNYRMSFNDAVNLQYNREPKLDNGPALASKSDVRKNMNVNQLKNDPKQKFQFLNLDKPTSVSSNNLNKLLVEKGILEGQGIAFYNAARKHNINEVYLIAHTLLETGHGTSTLASGVDVGIDKKGSLTLVTDRNKNNLSNIKTVYNMYGIGAVDEDALKGGAFTAYRNNWTSPRKAIEGGAKWITGNYIANEHNQNTLYKMRWNPNMYNGFAWKQYATDVGWAYKQANLIYNMYETVGFPTSMSFDYPIYQ